MFSRLKQKVQQESLNITTTNSKDEIQRTTSELIESINTEVIPKSPVLKATVEEAAFDSGVVQQRDDKTELLVNKIERLEKENEDCERVNEALRVEINNLKNEFRLLNENTNEINRQNESLKVNFNNLSLEMQKMKFEYDSFRVKFTNLENENFNLKNDKDQVLIKNAELSQKLELLKSINIHETDHGHKKMSTSSVNSIGNQIEEDGHVLKELRDELNEKNKTIKNLQQRLNDLKKTLQKELKFQSLPNEIAANTALEMNNRRHTSINDNHSQVEENFVNNSTAAIIPTIMVSTTKTTVTTNTQKITPTKQPKDDEINFKYLKHVVLKFVTSREYEAIHLIKALSVLLKFTNEEEKILRETLEYKMSWFGTKPKVAISNNV